MSGYSWENEWRLQNLKEESFLVKHVMDKTPKWVTLAKRKVPDSLQNTLDAAFNKAFVAVFEKGSGVIEKTYRKKKQLQVFQDNKKEMDTSVFQGKALRKFERQAKRTIYKNLTISMVEGIGLGLVGWGIPDIPIFVSIMLKSIYEIAISYGFQYTTEREKLFILKVIDTALKSGDTLREKDEQLNRILDRYSAEEMEYPQGEEDVFVTELQIKRQIDATSDALSHALLYGKFVQGTMVIGVVGGAADVTCLKQITEYAALKYKRRFLMRQRSQAMS